MAKVLEGLKYAPTHEWIKVEDNGIAAIGISDFAQSELGDISYVDLPGEGDVFEAGEEFGAVESVKAASDVYCPVGGTVMQVNNELITAPELLNEDPYENWIIKIKMTDPSELDALLDAAQYESSCE